MDRANKHLTFRGRGEDGLVHQARSVPEGMFGHCMFIYSVCHVEPIPVSRYTCRQPVTCIRCLCDEDYPHAIVTEEYGH